MIQALLGLLLLVPATADETFTLSGTVKFDGLPPPTKTIKAMLSDPKCAAMHPELPPKEDLVVDANGGVRWAFVYVKAGLEGKNFAPPAQPVQIDQVGCRYLPHVVGVQVGQRLNFKSSDPVLHNVHGLGFANPPFNWGLLQGGLNGVKFTNQEVMVKIVCDIHPWMSAHVGILEHPFFAVTDAQGRFEIKGVPKGKYTIGIWSEALDTEKQEKEIELKAAATLDWTLKRKA